MMMKGVKCMTLRCSDCRLVQLSSFRLWKSGFVHYSAIILMVATAFRVGAILLLGLVFTENCMKITKLYCKSGPNILVVSIKKEQIVMVKLVHKTSNNYNNKRLAPKTFTIVVYLHLFYNKCK